VWLTVIAKHNRSPGAWLSYHSFTLLLDIGRLLARVLVTVAVLPIFSFNLYIYMYKKVYKYHVKNRFKLYLWLQWIYQRFEKSYMEEWGRTTNRIKELDDWGFTVLSSSQVFLWYCFIYFCISLQFVELLSTNVYSKNNIQEKQTGINIIQVKIYSIWRGTHEVTNLM